MPPKTTDMSQVHEKHVAEVLGGEQHRGSGNQWNNQLDGAHAPDDPFGFRWDCKATTGKGITVTLDMIAKTIEQAQGHRPAIPLAWFGNDKLTEYAADWIAVTLMDFSELLEAAREGEGHRQAHDQLARELARVRQELEEARTKLAEAEAEIEQSREADFGPPATSAVVVGPLPRLPWTIVHLVHRDAGQQPLVARTDFDARGHQSGGAVREVHVERSPDSKNRPRIMVDGIWVPNADLIIDGIPVTRSCADDPSIESG